MKQSISEKKFYIKMELYYNKYSPVLISFLILINNILVDTKVVSDCNVDGYLFVPSLLTSLHMYCTRKLYNLCVVHKTFVDYAVVNSILYIIMNFIDTNWLFVDIIVFILFLLLFIIRYNKYKLMMTNHEKSIKN